MSIYPVSVRHLPSQYVCTWQARSCSCCYSPVLVSAVDQSRAGRNKKKVGEAKHFSSVLKRKIFCYVVCVLYKYNLIICACWRVAEKEVAESGFRLTNEPISKKLFVKTSETWGPHGTFDDKIGSNHGATFCRKHESMLKEHTASSKNCAIFKPTSPAWYTDVMTDMLSCQKTTKSIQVYLC